MGCFTNGVFGTSGNTCGTWDQGVSSEVGKKNIYMPPRYAKSRHAVHAMPLHTVPFRCHAKLCTGTDLKVFEYLKKFDCGVRVRLAMALGRRCAGTAVGTGNR